MFEEDGSGQKKTKRVDPILSKYKAPINKAEEALRQEDLLKAKKLEKEKIRMQGRKIPKAIEQEYERSLMLVATKGVVQLFNSVSEF